MANIADIVAEIYSLTDATPDSYPASAMLRRINQSYEKVVGYLISRNGQWQFDDSNFTSFPIGKANLVVGQQDYSFDVSHLVIERVEVMDNNGIWHLLNPIDIKNIGCAVEEYQKTNGLPTEYDKSGSSLLLYPAPAAANVTLENGLRVFFQRTAAIFTSGEVSTGTKKAGFASPFHYILAYDAAIPYCMTYKKDRVAAYMLKSKELLDGLLEFESNKEKDVPKRLSNRGVRFR